MDLDSVLGAGFVLVRPHLTERQRRLLYGAFALVLGQAGHPVSPTTVGRLLHAQAKAYLAARQPVVSVDTRKGTDRRLCQRRRRPLPSHEVIVELIGAPTSWWGWCTWRAR